MPILVISDIHSNLVALEATLAAAGRVEAIWCLGDIIGYGPRPNECVQHIRELASLVLVGNHDLACLGEVDLSDFNPLARRASEWTADQLSAESRSYLNTLPPYRRADQAVTLAHGSPRVPVWEYLLEPETADHSFEFFDTALCFVGHTHVPTIFHSVDQQPCQRRLPGEGETLRLEPNSRYIINPGSVGQPRDGDARAAYGLYDPRSRKFSFHRVPYDVAQTQQQMLQAGLPELLAARLSLGM